ncbi:MAG: ACP S-malonyltransferase [Microthrixaceae bacterium]|nr:ACP S-malonyltransferase [Microthrixaceae bacterium]
MPIAFLFPGQGSQTPRSGAEWQDTPQWSLVEAASEAAGLDVAHLLLVADAEELRDTANAQLSTYVVSMMVVAALSDGGLLPTHVAGHSLGEYTALSAAGVLSPGDGARLVAARGMAMRSAAAANPGTMAAIIGLDVDAVASVCIDVGADVWVANDNAPGQVVIAGSADAVESAGSLAKERGARRPMPLQVAGAFHTPLMAPAQDALDAALAQTPFHSPTLLPWANVDASDHSQPGDWPGLLSAQLCSPVRWREEIAAMAHAGADVFVEVGPGNVLSGMVKRIAPNAARHAAATPGAVGDLVQNLR